MIHNYIVNNKTKINEAKLLGYIMATPKKLFSIFDMPEEWVNRQTCYQWTILIGDEPLHDSSAHYIFNLRLIRKFVPRSMNSTLLWHVYGYSEDAVKVLADIVKTKQFYIGERK
jgi:hypothetical protein